MRLASLNIRLVERWIGKTRNWRLTKSTQAKSEHKPSRIRGGFFCFKRNAPMGNSTVYDFLDRVRPRRSMYLKNGSLEELEDRIGGYYSALANHQIFEECPQLTQSHFLSWLRLEKMSLPTGWAASVKQFCPDGKEPFDFFFELADEYRQLKFVKHLQIELSEHHNPTRKRCKIGKDKKMEKPLHVTICSYQPVDLFFLIFRYPKALTTGHIFFDNGNTQLSLEYAKNWCLDELQIEDSEWSPV